VHLNVIIPSYRAGATIAQAINPVLDTIPQKSGSDFTFDLTVVDSSDDNTAEIIRSQFPDVRLIKLPQRAFPGAARNRGVEATSGDVICFIDADAYPDSSWLENINDFLKKNPDIDAVGGSVLNANPLEGWSHLAHWCEFSGYGLHAPEGSRRVVPTVNVAIRRSAFMKFGPFLEDQFGNEDVLLFYRMMQAGSRLHFSRSMIVYHRNKTTLDGIYSHQFKLGESSGRARVMYDLPGSFLTVPGGTALIPFVKLHFIGWRLFTQEQGEYLKYIGNKFRVFIAMCFLASGFRKGVADARREKSV
jgi:glycosyltransferase involved in cell wall biosynthesis